MVECLVVGSHLRFDGVWQRPQQIVTRLATHVPVLFVEEPFPSRSDDDRVTTEGGVDILRPLRAAHDFEHDARTLARVREWVGGRRAAVWLYTPMMLSLADALPDATLVYDCMDELAAFDFAPPALRARERALTSRAALVFCGGTSLYDARRELGSKAVLAPSGVEFEHFARPAEPHPLFAHLPHPIFGYVGVIDERIDVASIEALARRDAQVALIGPLAKIDPTTLPRRANVHFTGRMAYDDLPALLAGLDVAIMPFAANAATRYISPTKTPEYLAAGKPVVSTPIVDVARAYGDVVTVVDGGEAFADACLAVAARPDAASVARGIERARTVGWDEIVRGMWNRLERE
jgi:glycosyltransferase involved in cell wall biosynthesis